MHFATSDVYRRQSDIVGLEADVESQGSPITELLSISTVQLDTGLSVVAQGELDLSSAPLLEAALLAAEATEAASITLDIDGVSFIDSTGLRTLLEAHVRSQQDGNRIRLTKGSTQAQRLFALAAVDEILPFVDQ
ncbi:MAG TPA: STAS domain-containing protein [Solirubrobacteraceae bacterium]